MVLVQVPVRRKEKEGRQDSVQPSVVDNVELPSQSFGGREKPLARQRGPKVRVEGRVRVVALFNIVQLELYARRGAERQNEGLSRKGQLVKLQGIGAS